MRATVLCEVLSCGADSIDVNLRGHPCQGKGVVVAAILKKGSARVRNYKRVARNKDKESEVIFR